MSVVVKAALFTDNLTEESMDSKRESSDTRNRFVLPSILKLISASWFTTTGRAVRVCGLTGVITKLSQAGCTSGPPQLREYPVEPVGVATIMPSAQYELSSCLFTNTST